MSFQKFKRPGYYNSAIAVDKFLTVPGRSCNCAFRIKPSNVNDQQWIAGFSSEHREHITKQKHLQKV
ncbi:hypothetical protein [Nostoc sp. UIC 10630]|uniref:hypothetical protein n=1 Tax=Nostoc sp. UIC 10630 TaxID=2100146 RepID=UPI0013D234A7|nr:hypothetical protein [Nostoc sp. UIC 10630]NEU80173.1 hypothetical protein [Nostoc sp. UIC 10630]